MGCSGMGESFGRRLEKTGRNLPRDGPPCFLIVPLPLETLDISEGVGFEDKTSAATIPSPLSFVACA